MITPEYKSAKEDAEEILEHVMCRNNWGINVRDELALALEKIVRREHEAMRYYRMGGWSK